MDTLLKGVNLVLLLKNRMAKGLKAEQIYPGPVLIVSHGAVYWATQNMLDLAVKDTPNAIPLYHSLQQDVRYPMSSQIIFLNIVLSETTTLKKPYSLQHLPCLYPWPRHDLSLRLSLE